MFTGFELMFTVVFALSTLLLTTIIIKSVTAAESVYRKHYKTSCGDVDECRPLTSHR